MKILGRTVKIMAVALVLCIAGAGCALFPWGERARNVENSKQLRIGMTKAEVLEVMGEPVSDETYCKPDVWYYYVETVWHDGLVTEDECIPLVFRSGRLIGWGNLFYSDYRVKLKDSGRELEL